ncbi:hypothetical protein RM549_17130 [Salegentibacter sp. F188]|uniref:Uncharacterized protein n=1 Tax=Autumnicola patrickiae TaxID=3075591 RepID=A0ABU3E6A1_9FLAO|nr:hypothetical protein [Salegentibacter sp. F188]MDT0691520.1 hypothetical protein [Salegentibacter sp. F188]
MSTKDKNSAPYPTDRDNKKHERNQSTEVERSSSNIKIIGLIIVLIFVVLIILVFAGIIG